MNLPSLRAGVAEGRDEKPPDESRQAFIERMLPDCAVTKATAWEVLGQTYDLQVEFGRAKTARERHDLSQAIRGNYALLGLDRRVRSGTEELTVSAALAEAKARIEESIRSEPEHWRQEAILKARHPEYLSKPALEEWARRARMTPEELLEAGRLSVEAQEAPREPTGEASEGPQEPAPQD